MSSTTSSPIIFVSMDAILADVSIKDEASASLRTTTSVLLTLLVSLSFTVNLLLLATVLSSSKLRSNVLYILFCNVAVLNLLDVLLSMFVSLLFVAYGQWPFGEILCRVNAMMQRFVHLEVLMGLMVMAIERAIGLLFAPTPVTRRRALTLLTGLWCVSVCFSAPIVLGVIPSKPYRFRYLCAVDSGAEIAYSLVQLVIYGGCLFVLLLCFGAILRSQPERQLPHKAGGNYSDFIRRSRALQDYQSMGRLVLTLFICFVLIQGPYIALNFFVEIRNSAELLTTYGSGFDLPQDAETLITWLTFIYPLLYPLLIYGCCSEIWTKLLVLICCRRPAFTVPQVAWGLHDYRGPIPGGGNVMTLVATNEGLQLRLPNSFNPVANGCNAQAPETLDPNRLNTPGTSQPVPVTTVKAVQLKLENTKVPVPVKVDTKNRTVPPRSVKASSAPEMSGRRRWQS